MIGLFDIDSLVYEACYSAEDLEEAQESFWGRYNDVQFHMDNRYGKCTVIPIGFCTNNYRKKLDTSYKAQRTSPKPEFFEDLIIHIKENLNILTRSGIEDYRQFECTIFNYRKREFITIDKEQALYNLYEQMVVGDRADNVLVCKGFGEKWCEKNLYGKNEFAMLRTVFTLYKKLNIF